MSENRYAKLENGVLVFAPKNKDNIFNYDLDIEAMVADGYKQFVPATIEPGKNYTNFRYKETKTKITEICDEVPDPTPEEKAQQREAQFDKEFFPTSLGYIRRIVTKADGSKADFLLDYVALIAKAVEKNLPYPIKVYDRPESFDEDIIDWESLQHDAFANDQFINECLAQVGNDFKPIPQEQSNEE